jgi:hypothetical protein
MDIKILFLTIVLPPLFALTLNVDTESIWHRAIQIFSLLALVIFSFITVDIQYVVAITWMMSLLYATFLGYSTILYVTTTLISAVFIYYFLDGDTIIYSIVACITYAINILHEKHLKEIKRRNATINKN